VPRFAALAASLLLATTALTACGGNDVEDAEKAASTYVNELGQRDGAGTCKQMTEDLQAQFRRAVTAANPQFRGRSCERLMQVALNTIPSDQLRLFADAEITDMKVDGDNGTFRYTIPPNAAVAQEITVNGRMAKQDGEWKVSCCVPGQGGG
jgi:predicted small secreted protein